MTQRSPLFLIKNSKSELPTKCLTLRLITSIQVPVRVFTHFDLYTLPTHRPWVETGNDFIYSFCHDIHLTVPGPQFWSQETIRDVDFRRLVPKSNRVTPQLRTKSFSMAPDIFSHPMALFFLTLSHVKGRL